MPRLTQAVPKYRLHRQSGQAITTINGRDHLLGPHGTKASKLEYDRLISEWLASGRSLSYGSYAIEFTVVELIAEYLKFAKDYYGAGNRGTFATMKRVARPLKALYGRTAAADFGVLQFKTLRESFAREGLSRNYVNECMRRIIAIFRWGAAEGKIPASVPQTLSIIPGLRKGRSSLRETSPIKPVEIEDVDATLPYLSPIVGAMVSFQLLTGARPGEVCKLTPGMIDRSCEVWEANLSEHKTSHHGKDRTIYIGPSAQRTLAPFLLRASDTNCFSPAEAMEWMRAQRAKARKTPLSCGNSAGTNRSGAPRRKPGSTYTSQSYGVAVGRACVAAGIRKWNPNQLRHTLATRVRREFDLDGAKTLLGHASISTTQVYAEKDRSRAVEIARRIG